MSVGIGVMSLVAHLETVRRVPIGQIRKLLWTLWGLKISTGEIAQILRDVAEKNSDLPDVAARVDAVMDVYHRATESVKQECTELERSRMKVEFERELFSLAKPYVKAKASPQRVLAERMTSFIAELFVFVGNPEIPSENNAAERAIRPAVVARKISGSSRSARGSNTCSVLRSLSETWSLQNRNTIDACRETTTRSATAQAVSAQ